METKQKRTQKSTLPGGARLDFICEDFEKGRWLDTKVYINDTYLTTIDGNNVDQFMKSMDFMLLLYQI